MLGSPCFPASSLNDRALDALRAGPISATHLAVDVMGLTQAPAVVAERLAIALLGADPRVRQLADGRWALQGAAQGAPLLQDAAYAVVDVETTGSQPLGRDRVIEVAVVVMEGERLDVVLDTLVNPGRPLAPVITSITGISEAMVRAAPPFEEVIEAVEGALAGRIFVAHNAGFDWAFLDAEFRRARAMTLAANRLCTVRLARRFVRGLPSYGLDHLTEYYGLENPARHRAAGDAWVTALLLRRFLARAREEGLRTLAELEALSRTRGRRRRRAGRKVREQ